MKVLIVLATKEEIKIDFPHIITGIGMVSTAINVTNALVNCKYDLVINAGIAGSFDRSLKIGQVVEVIQDELSEVGAQNGPIFLTPKDMQLSIITKVKSKPRTNLTHVKGITVNTVHGDDMSIQKIVHRLNPQVETMEGAACMLSCQSAGVPCLQLRAISNYIEKRNRCSWNISLAIQNLNHEISNFLSQL